MTFSNINDQKSKLLSKLFSSPFRDILNDRLNESLESKSGMVPTVGGATPSVSFRRREDFRSLVPASAQFPRVGRRGKKLERSTRVCRLRRPCDRSGQCQRCRSPPRRRRRRRAPRRMHRTIGERRHGRNPLAHDARVKNP